MGAIFILLLWAARLTVTDLATRRLPDALTIPPALAALAAAAVWDPSVLAAGLGWPVLYLLTGLLTGGVGGGDIKLAVPLGILAAACAGAGGVLAAVAVAGVLSTLTAWRAGDTAHGPAMLVGCGAVCAAGAG